MRRIAFVMLLLIVVACSAEIPNTPASIATPQPTIFLPTHTTMSVEKDVEIAKTVMPSAADADVLFVDATLSGNGSWTFQVTVAHPDTGWDDYANGWDVVLPDGTVIKPQVDSPFTRLLAHPHETEQPFTRDQVGIIIPPDATQVTVRAHDLVDGFGGREVVVDLHSAETSQYKVTRP